MWACFGISPSNKLYTYKNFKSFLPIHVNIWIIKKSQDKIRFSFFKKNGNIGILKTFYWIPTRIASTFPFTFYIIYLLFTNTILKYQTNKIKNRKFWLVVYFPWLYFKIPFSSRMFSISSESIREVWIYNNK